MICETLTGSILNDVKLIDFMSIIMLKCNLIASTIHILQLLYIYLVYIKVTLDIFLVRFNRVST